MPEGEIGRNPDRSALLLVTPLFLVALPSLLYCGLVAMLWLHGAPAKGPVVFHLPPKTVWDRLFAVEASVYEWIARWNSVATAAATLVFVAMILRARWRHWLVLALIPYSVLLCADFTLRWRYALMP
jgi:hypothetical protein